VRLGSVLVVTTVMLSTTLENWSVATLEK